MLDTRLGAGAAKTPWHLWVIGVIALVWYVLGAATIQLAQLGMLQDFIPDMKPDEIAYYAAQPAWFRVTTGIATYGSVLGAILLLMRKRPAAPVFAIAFVLILLNNVSELSNGTSRVYANNAAAAVTGVIAVIALFMAWYSRTMHKRGVLR